MNGFATKPTRGVGPGMTKFFDWLETKALNTKYLALLIKDALSLWKKTKK